MNPETIAKFDSLKTYFKTGLTSDIDTRVNYLKKLYQSIAAHEADIASALFSDLHKSPEESYISETSVVLMEIKQQIKHIRRWSRSKRVRTPLFLFPSSSRIIYEPKGVVFIMAPWNYPFQLAIDPLVGAVAAGNCVALKPSSTSAATCDIIKRIISEVFPPEYVFVFDGGHDQTAELLECRFDHIFFTGGISFGRTVMEKAAANLTPVTLELGGKSPCIVDKDADTEISGRKIVWGKLMNAGQTCIAPDYIFVHSEIKERFIESLKRHILQFYGSDIKNNPAYPRIISDKAFARIKGYLDDADNIIFGGESDAGERFIAPAIIDDPAKDSPVMTEEIFGPIFPVLTFEDMQDVISFINSREKPLALYYFGKKKEGLKILSRTTSGGACINDTIVHIANPNLPFGGIGSSGTGRYHGRHSFETFSNVRSVVLSKHKKDITLRYPPYNKNFRRMRKLL